MSLNKTLLYRIPSFQAERMKDGAWPCMYGAYGKT